MIKKLINAITLNQIWCEFNWSGWTISIWSSIPMANTFPPDTGSPSSLSSMVFLFIHMWCSCRVVRCCFFLEISCRRLRVYSAFSPRWLCPGLRFVRQCVDLVEQNAIATASARTPTLEPVYSLTASRSALFRQNAQCGTARNVCTGAIKVGDDDIGELHMRTI